MSKNHSDNDDIGGDSPSIAKSGIDDRKGSTEDAINDECPLLDVFGQSPQNHALPRGDIGEDDNAGLNDSGFDETRGSSGSFSSQSPPSRPEQISRTLKHIDLQNFGKQLRKAAKSAFPSPNRSRYANVYVLIFSWASEDRRLPVNSEIAKLRSTFERIFHYEVEEFKIPDQKSHVKVSARINDFIEVNDDQADDLKIVYYGGHAKLSKTKEVLWARTSETNEKCETVTWTAIQATLQQAQSDALILLDCCYAGVVDGGEGNGVNELLAACSFDRTANGVGQYSFTTSLNIELNAMASQIQASPYRKSFSIGELYANMFRRSQSYIPQGLANERYPPPIHVLLRSDEKFPRGIQLSVHTIISAGDPAESLAASPRLSSETLSRKRPLSGETQGSPSKQTCLDNELKPLTNILGSSSFVSSGVVGVDSSSGEHSVTNGDFRAERNTSHSTQSIPHWPKGEDPSWPADAPRMLLAVRFTEDFHYDQLSPELFIDWLRTMPADIASVVHVEAAFKCDSTLLLVALPIFVWTYLSDDPAIFPLGEIHSSNMITAKRQEQKKAAVEVAVQKDQASSTILHHHTGEHFSCTWCGAAFMYGDWKSLDLHVENNHPLCNLCNVRSTSAMKLVQHEADRHVSCPRCSAFLGSKGALDGHMRQMHQACYLCSPEVCEYFASTAYAQDHKNPRDQQSKTPASNKESITHATSSRPMESWMSASSSDSELYRTKDPFGYETEKGHSNKLNS